MTNDSCENPFFRGDFSFSHSREGQHFLGEIQWRCDPIPKIREALKFSFPLFPPPFPLEIDPVLELENAPLTLLIKALDIVTVALISLPASS